MRIITLSEHPASLNTVCTWIHQEFIDPDRFTLQQLTARFRSMHPDRIPLCLVALEEGQCVGTVSLFTGDLPARRDLTPWLAALYVPPEARERGVGRSLVGECLQRAAAFGYKTVYLRTEHAAAFYRRLGWEVVSEEVTEEGLPTLVFQSPSSFV